ncbi:unnamed protein product [Protopolystoma xenopodis]|uniref:Uncharacterized protein n=1 Tax=Protopolystoma xenopodis TaxID=117903 RepID=A0A3S4ZTS3_9PLAT|nr:unnamed protein product [Protopolystoma xenopodis]
MDKRMFPEGFHLFASAILRPDWADVNSHHCVCASVRRGNDQAEDVRRGDMLRGSGHLGTVSQSQLTGGYRIHVDDINRDFMERRPDPICWRWAQCKADAETSSKIGWSGIR